MTENLKSLQITAFLTSNIAVHDNYSPSIDALLEWLVLEEQGLTSSNPSEEDLISVDLPLLKAELRGSWYWAVSSPHYQCLGESTSRFRNRWDFQESHLDWGKKKAKVDGSQGQFKSYDLPLYLRDVPRIDWFVVGNKAEIERLLANCTGLGKKRSQGYGQVSHWEVSEIAHDWHLFRGDKLARPVPVELADGLNLEQYPIQSWGYRPPARLQCNQAICYMPTDTVVVRGRAA